MGVEILTSCSSWVTASGFPLVFEVKAAEEHGVLLAELHESLGPVVAETGGGRARK